ncbi:putative C-type lectin-like domain family 1 isoform 7 precursor [Homo sapiens]|uniref:putative C-type lectin-like domain family 1 isoform 7 precursor n=1 Tax=Homo sapiens TaxID=9606 RepID=UPI003EBF2438
MCNNIILLVIVIVLNILVSFNFSTVHKSCPAKDWKVHKGKCYWIAETKKSWNKSQNDCAINNSYLMVIQDITAMAPSPEWQSSRAAE